MRYRKLVRVLSLALALNLAPSPATCQELLFAVGEWAPFTSSSGGGLAVEIVEAACAAVGLKPSFAFTPWRRAEAMVRAGEAFGTFPYARTREREASFAFSEPFLSSPTVILFNADYRTFTAASFSGLDDLRPYRVGVVAGSALITDQLRAKGVHVEETETIEASLKKLLHGRIDMIIDDVHIVDAMRMASGAGNLVVLPLGDDFGFATRVYRVMISRRYPGYEALTRRIDEGIAIIRKNGTLDAIVARYREPSGRRERP